MSLYLLFDVGNTRLKWAAVESSQKPSDQQKKLWAYSGSISSKSLQSPEHKAELADYIAKTLPKPDAIGFSCVAGADAIDNLKSLFPQWGDIEWKQLRGDSSYEGIRTLYQDPSKLGADRLAAVIGARALSKSNTLIINAGTATTIDLLGSNGLHYGGWILPGLGLMQKSLEANTAQLPLAVRGDAPLGFGLSTNDAIIGGCDAAQIGAIQFAIDVAKDLNHPVERIWLDGGNSKVIASEINRLGKLKSLTIEPSEGLVLRGLWAWLLNNL
ncbi:type III pantothenate kinase [Polynucleobacter asymbioticus]|jgi:type III pantothenate kinase|uniref:Type III pantothenate kinase n=1 Tax=Polynucleobacter asymbioticus TaxID=576611 RepID=A0AAC9IYW9_9BURK|nr:type III pantothenate kinase [Polynucleobacter asymbioticus]APB99835.1 type III pantothenate kinase [Polynucleobacter asymbioticus]APC02132.1 type III pantothenate kinase [Polynucleobacter asymbioticus]